MPHTVAKSLPGLSCWGLHYSPTIVHLKGLCSACHVLHIKNKHRCEKNDVFKIWCQCIYNCLLCSLPLPPSSYLLTVGKGTGLLNVTWERMWKSSSFYPLGLWVRKGVKQEVGGRTMWVLTWLHRARMQGNVDFWWSGSTVGIRGNLHDTAQVGLLVTTTMPNEPHSGQPVWEP